MDTLISHEATGRNHHLRTWQRTDAAFKSSWDVRTYELTSRYYHVGYVQVTLVETLFYIKVNDFLKLYIYKMMNEECASLCIYEGDVN